MILPIHQHVRNRTADAVSRLYALPPGDPAIAEMSLEAPPNRALGDIAVPVAFALARPGYELGERILAEVVPPWPEVCSGT